MPGDRTEQATQHRREKARKEGDILHSRELTAAAGTLAGVVMLGVLGGRCLELWRAAFAGFLALSAPAQWEPETMGLTIAAVRRLSVACLGPVALVMLAVAAAGLAAGVMQTGGITLHAGSIGFRLDRVNPLSNAKNLFSMRALARLGKSMLPVALLSVFAVAAHRPADDHSAVFDRAPRDAGYRCLRPVPGCGVAHVCVGHGGLPGGVAEPRIAPQDEQARPARGDEGDRRLAADPRPHPRIAAPDAPPQGEGRRFEGGGGADQSHPLCGGAGLRLCHHGCAPGAGQGAQPAGRGDQGRGALGRRAGSREPASGALALSLRRSRPGHPRRSVCRGGGDSRLPLPAAGGRGDARAARDARPRGPGTAAAKPCPENQRGRNSAARLRPRRAQGGIR